VDKHTRGAYSEAIVAAWMVRQKFIVYTMEFRATGPIDLVCLHPASGEWLLLDVKSDSKRAFGGRTTPTRIHRVRTSVQKKLGVHFAYVQRDAQIGFAPRLPQRLKGLIDDDI
jgi:Holliday junction resolvase-like predicted endonuclease